MNRKIQGIIECIINKNLSFIHWFKNWNPDETVWKPLVELKNMVLNIPATVDDQIK